jgi:HEPN domain
LSYSIENYKKDIESLLILGDKLFKSLYYFCYPEKFKEEFEDEKKREEFEETFPCFHEEYQSWYSESKLLIKQLLPERLDDFVSYYEKPKNRHNLNEDNYKLSDFLIGNTFSTIMINESITLPMALFTQQKAILNSLRKIFESSLYDIKLHLQAEMFDDDLEAAEYLLENNFNRAAGAMTGVVVERHLKQVCLNHNVKLDKSKNHTINYLNDLLKKESVYDITYFRRIQLLGDIRNKCDHDKKEEPSKDDINDLINGTKKIIKTIF